MIRDDRAISSTWMPWLEALWRHIVAIWQDDAVRVSLLVFLVLRLVTGALALYMVRDSTLERPSMLRFDPLTRRGNASGEIYYPSLPMNAPLASIVAPWRLYDTVWYMKVAMQGYRHDNSIVFPPLYPVLVRYLAPLLGYNYVLASLIISNISCLIYFFLLYKLIQREFGDNALATRTLVIIAAFPTAYYLMAGYTEPLFLALTLGAILAAFDKKWLLAGGLAFFASLTRLQGIVLCLPLAWIAYVQYRESGWQAIMERVPAVAGAALGTACYYGYIMLNNLGSFEAAYNNGWKLTTRMPWAAIQTYLQRLFSGQAQGYENDNAFMVLLMIGLAVIVTLRMSPVFSIYTWSTLFGLLMRYHYGQGLEGAQFESIIRYVLMLFPCFIALAMLLKRWWLLLPYSVIAIQWQVFLLDNFMHWRWVA